MARTFPPVRTLPSPRPGATSPSPAPTPACTPGAGAIAFTRTCEFTMHAGTTLTATLQWPFRVFRADGDSIRLGRTVTLPRGQRQFPLPAVRPGEATIYAGTPQSNAPGPPLRPIQIFATVTAYTTPHPNPPPHTST